MCPVFVACTGHRFDFLQTIATLLGKSAELCGNTVGAGMAEPSFVCTCDAKNGESTEEQVAKASKVAAALSQSYMVFPMKGWLSCRTQSDPSSLGLSTARCCFSCCGQLFHEPFQGAHSDQRSRSWSHCPQDRRGSCQQAGIVYYGWTAGCMFS